MPRIRPSRGNENPDMPLRKRSQRNKKKRDKVLLETHANYQEDCQRSENLNNRSLRSSSRVSIRSSRSKKFSASNDFDDSNDDAEKRNLIQTNHMSRKRKALYHETMNENISDNAKVIPKKARTSSRIADLKIKKTTSSTFARGKEINNRKSSSSTKMDKKKDYAQELALKGDSDQKWMDLRKHNRKKVNGKTAGRFIKMAFWRSLMPNLKERGWKEIEINTNDNEDFGSIFFIPPGVSTKRKSNKWFSKLVDVINFVSNDTSYEDIYCTFEEELKKLREIKQPKKSFRQQFNFTQSTYPQKSARIGERYQVSHLPSPTIVSG